MRLIFEMKETTKCDQKQDILLYFYMILYFISRIKICLIILVIKKVDANEHEQDQEQTQHHKKRTILCLCLRRERDLQNMKIGDGSDLMGNRER